MNPRVRSVAVADEHTLIITFTNDEVRQLDVRPLLLYPVFERLRERAYFALAGMDHGTIAWPGGVDLDPDMVYLDSVPIPVPASA